MEDIERVEYWRQALGEDVVGCRCQELLRGGSPSRIFRIFLQRASGDGGLATVICKESRAPWPQTDPEGVHREWSVYQDCLVRLPGVGAALLYQEQGNWGNRLVLEDLETEHSFRPLWHRWQWEEVRGILRIFARLHVDAELCPAGGGRLMPSPDQRWQPERIAAATGILAAEPRAHGLPNLVDALLPLLLDQRAGWAGERQTLLHMDFNPANAALGRADGQQVRLIDWHIAAWGPAAFDIAAFFYQPYHNHVGLDRRRIWEEYLRMRYAIDGRVRDGEEDRVLFWYALGFAGLSFLPPVARTFQRQGGLEGWWGNTLEAIVDNLQWCLEEVDR